MPKRLVGPLCTAPSRCGKAGGFTLVELLIVLVVIAVVAGVATTIFSTGLRVRDAGDIERSVEEVATFATLREVAGTLTGTSVTEGGYRGDLGTLPTRLGGLFLNIDGERPYDPARKRGWRGAYLSDQAGAYGTYLALGDNFPTTPTERLDDPVVLDGWGKPLLLQQSDTRDARLVSAGPDRVLDTASSSPVDPDRGDDIVLFLLRSDPNL